MYYQNQTKRFMGGQIVSKKNESSEATVVLESKPCPSGCPQGDDFVVNGHDRFSGLPGNFTVIKCRTCHLMRTNPRPTTETIGYYYPESYGPYQSSRVTNPQNIPDKRSILLRTLRRLFEFNMQCLPPISPPGRMLEVGCASGAFMHRMAHQGWTVEGVEFSKAAAENTRSLGYRIFTGTIEDMPDPENVFDVVVGWVVLEHLHEPVLALEKMYCWTKPGGWLVISVPNAASMDFRLFKGAWYALHLPNHLYHFTPETIHLMLNRAGWAVENIFPQRILSNWIGSVGHIMEELGIMHWLAKKLIAYPSRPHRANFLFYPLAYLLGCFGQTGLMTIWARKQ
jgi:2-polyprenyl-3-methyl-5-hydroxy-6-metoxy-1,4-benzoquinol methylase